VTRARRIAWASLAVAAALACSEPTTGPARIVWGRHACDHCGMAISEPRYAAQIRSGPHEVARFDDFGCALLWLEAHGRGRARGFFVMDETGEHWLDARTASFVSGQRTPMAYGWAAVARGAPGALSFDAAREAILARERGRAAHGRP
jgi:nitrous oxide reductase accessory protein NosL